MQLIAQHGHYCSLTSIGDVAACDDDASRNSLNFFPRATTTPMSSDLISTISRPFLLESEVIFAKIVYGRDCVRPPLRIPFALSRSSPEQERHASILALFRLPCHKNDYSA